MYMFWKEKYVVWATTAECSRVPRGKMSLKSNPSRTRVAPYTDTPIKPVKSTSTAIWKVLKKIIKMAFLRRLILFLHLRGQSFVKGAVHSNVLPIGLGLIWVEWLSRYKIAQNTFSTSLVYGFDIFLLSCVLNFVHFPLEWSGSWGGRYRILFYYFYRCLHR